MKVLFYSHSSTQFGAPSSLVNLVTGIKLIDRTTQAMVILPSPGGLERDLKDADIPYKIIPHFKWFYDRDLYEKKRRRNFLLAWLWLFYGKTLRLVKNLWYLPAHLKHCSAFAPDIVYVNSSLCPMGALVAHMKNIRWVWHHRETVNDPETGFFLDFGLPISTWLFRKAHLHIHPSAYLMQTYAALDKAKSRVVYNGVFSKTFQPAKVLLQSQGIAVGMVGRISRQKGQEMVLKAFTEIDDPNLSLALFGNGESWFIQNLQRQFPSPRISYKGFTQRNDIFGQVDVVIVAGKNESFGRVVTEAFAYSKPVVALRSGALPEIVRDRQNGFLFSTTEELKEILVEIGQPGKKERLTAYGRRARLDFESTFSLEQYSEKIYHLLKTLQDGKTHKVLN